FNILNLICNYLPVLIIITYSYLGVNKFDFFRLKSLKYTTLYVVFLLCFGLILPTYTNEVIVTEMLPLFLFLILVIVKAEKNINFEYLLKFFRYTFIACIVIYMSPVFGEQMKSLFAEGIIFKEKVPDI